MDPDLTTALSSLTLQPSTEQPSIPSEIIQHILSFLPPAESTTLTTLLACQLVSHSFAAASLAAVVWRPLVSERWKRGDLKYPTSRLPLEEDQKLVDALFEGGLAPREPSEVLRVRFQLDGIARRHIDRLVNGTKDRLMSIDTVCAFEGVLHDELNRLRLHTVHAAGKEMLCRLHWIARAYVSSKRVQSARIWQNIAAGAVTSAEEAFELGVLALSDFADDEWKHDSASGVECLALAASEAFSDDEPNTRDRERQLIYIVAKITTLVRMMGIKTNVADLGSSSPASDSTELDHFFFAPAFELATSRSRFLSDESRDITDAGAVSHSHILDMAVLVMIGRRLSPSLRVGVRLPDQMHTVEFYCQDDPSLAVYIDVARLVGPSRAPQLYAELLKSHSMPVPQLLDYFAGQIASIAAEAAVEDPSRRTHPLAATLAVAVVQYSFHGGTVRGEKAPSPLYFFAHPARVYDMPLLESMLPSVPSRYQAHCRELIRRMRAEDARAVVPRRRSSACRPRLSTGEVFLHMSRNELAIVVGWQEKESPRRSDVKPPAEPVPEPRFEYLALVGPFHPYSLPVIVQLEELVAVVRLGEQRLMQLAQSHETLGRYFNSVRDREDGRMVFTPSAWLKAQYPDG